VPLRKQLRHERRDRSPRLWDLDSQLTLPGLHVPRTELITQPRAIVAQAALPVRPALIPGWAQSGVELVLDRPLDDQPGAEPTKLGQHLLRIINHTFDSTSSISACISAHGGTVRLTA
jgi:hypothetical protein